MANGTMTSKPRQPHTLESVWNAVNSLDRADRKRLVRLIIEEDEKSADTAFPKIPKDWRPSPIVFKMVANRLPVEVDIEKERQSMWEELAR